MREKRNLFINLSNHSSDSWSDEQWKEAQSIGEILDYPFPQVDPEATTEEVCVLAHQVAEDILKWKPSVVMCQGEFSLSYHVIRLLKENDVTVVSACSRRNAVEKQLEDGSSQKVSVFQFVKFRAY